MTSQEIIDHAKAQRKQQKLLDAQLCECATQLVELCTSQQRNLSKWLTVAGGSHPISNPPSKADAIGAQEVCSEQLFSLLEQGADINAAVSAFDPHGNPTRTTSLINFLLQADSHVLHPVAGDLAELGARLDNDTIALMGRHAFSLTRFDRPSIVPDWFRDLTDIAIQTPGINWSGIIQAPRVNRYDLNSAPLGTVDMWIAGTIEQYCPGFLGKLHASQDARGEVRARLTVPGDLSIEDAHVMLRNTVLNNNHFARQDRLDVIRYLVGMGADPCWFPVDVPDNPSALHYCIKALDCEILSVFFSGGLHAENHMVDLAISSALRQAYNRRKMDGTIRQEALDRTERKLVGVLLLLQDQRVKIDLSEQIKWEYLHTASIVVSKKDGVIAEEMDAMLPGSADRVRSALEAQALDGVAIAPRATSRRRL